MSDFGVAHRLPNCSALPFFIEFSFGNYRFDTGATWLLDVPHTEAAMALRLTLLSIRPAANHHAALSAAAEQYLQRCGRTLPAASRVFRTEAALLTAVADEKRAGAALFWMADLGGKALDSVAFAEQIREAREGGIRHLLLAVGAANGWSAVARSAADLRLSLGAMTLPHELAWLVLAEQVYRASTILQGHPYHLGH